MRQLFNQLSPSGARRSVSVVPAHGGDREAGDYAEAGQRLAAEPISRQLGQVVHAVRDHASLRGKQKVSGHADAYLMSLLVVYLSHTSSRSDNCQNPRVESLSRQSSEVRGTHGNAAAVVPDLQELEAAILHPDHTAVGSEHGSGDEKERSHISVAPASSEFSMSSFTAWAGLCTTSPAAIFLMTSASRSVA